MKGQFRKHYCIKWSIEWYFINRLRKVAIPLCCDVLHTHTRGEGRREGTRTGSHKQQQENRGKQQRHRTGRGAHNKQAEQRRKESVEGGGESTRNPTWQAEEQKRKPNSKISERGQQREGTNTLLDTCYLFLYKMNMLYAYKMLFRGSFCRELAWSSIKCPSRALYFIIL